MAFKQSPNIVVAGAMGVATGVAIVGGLVLALSLPATAEQETFARSTASGGYEILVDASKHSVASGNVIHQTSDLELRRTYGNSTARNFALSRDEAVSTNAADQTHGEIVASNDVDPASEHPRS